MGIASGRARCVIPVLDTLACCAAAMLVTVLSHPVPSLQAISCGRDPPTTASCQCVDILYRPHLVASSPSLSLPLVHYRPPLLPPSHHRRAHTIQLCDTHVFLQISEQDRKHEERLERPALRGVVFHPATVLYPLLRCCLPISPYVRPRLPARDSRSSAPTQDTAELSPQVFPTSLRRNLSYNISPVLYRPATRDRRPLFILVYSCYTPVIPPLGHVLRSQVT